MSKFIFSLALIICSLFLGYSLQRLSATGVVRLPIALEDFRKTLQKFVLLFVVPVTFVGAVWVLNINSSLTIFPLLSLVAYFGGGGAAIGAARLWKLPAAKVGSLFTCGYFSNIGSIGGLVCYLFLGEQGFALSGLYRLLDPLSYYVIGFSITKSYSLHTTANIPFALQVKKLLTDPFIMVNVSSLTLGALLNLSGVERPAIFVMINALFIPTGTMLILVSIGLTLKFSRITLYLKECMLIAGIKFVLLPLGVALIALFLGYGELDGGLPLKALIVLAAMPVGLTAVVATSVYDLDVDLTNSCFLFTTSCIVLVLPVLYYITR